MSRKSGRQRFHALRIVKAIARVTSAAATEASEFEQRSGLGRSDAMVRCVPEDLRL
jgi:hypothetical protein